MDKIYQVYRNSDTTEGRGPMVFAAAFKDLDTAVDFVSQRCGIMGRKCQLEKLCTYWTMNDHDIKETFVYDSVVEFNQQQQYDIKESALKKLTTEEKKALGLM